ncbi:hypothetical protein GGP41_003686 [Bipolaris sorokiniana]|uniref:Uncharacterized protein n=1 Tax=Cochliobolus sativus TaxID=45130 RepID=A0A8H5ZCP0_COCSA|nr:hypothetical protein GGP41_003686 [Bipolaris sorokiniana]
MALQHPKHPPNGTTPPWTQSHNRDETAIGFLDLPRELRDLVYDFAFRIQGALLIYTRDPTAARLVARAMNIQHAGRGPSAPQPLVNGALPVALLRTCRQLNAESSPILYSANPPRGDELWRPGFFAVGGNKTREQRVGIVALWMSLGCCWADADQGLKACLHLEMGRQPARIGRDEFVGSKFAPEEEEDDGVWDYTEFADAFDRMKGF